MFGPLPSAGSVSRNNLSEWCNTGTPRRVRNCFGMLAFIRDPVPPARSTNPTSSIEEAEDSEALESNFVLEDAAWCDLVKKAVEEVLDD
mmetsp:Transcript_52996/g.78573  ORF Transcript_52996/g.78573 Transcript_52996/m.78573 type:complete len:89 (-) Transcript_52996:195-461(-)